MMPDDLMSVADYEDALLRIEQLMEIIGPFAERPHTHEQELELQLLVAKVEIYERHHFPEFNS
jgi:hypothetical protein